MASVPTLVRIEENGQITLPAAIRQRLGLEEGDLVAVSETPDGVIITFREALVSQALDRIGVILREEGLTLEELIESGRDERDALVRELYGIEPTVQPDLRFHRCQRPLRGHPLQPGPRSRSDPYRRP